MYILGETLYVLGWWKNDYWTNSNLKSQIECISVVLYNIVLKIISFVIFLKYVQTTTINYSDVLLNLKINNIKWSYQITFRYEKYLIYSNTQ